MPDSQHKYFREDDRFIDIQADFEETAEWLFRDFLFDGLDQEDALNAALGRLKKVIQAASGPAFDDAGFISPMQICTEAEVIRWFGFTTHREKLFDRIRKWISLARAVKARRILLDGSFVTEKSEPDDVDAVVLLPDDFRDQLCAGNAEAVELRDMFLSREPKEIFAAEDEEDWWGWFKFFSRTRETNGRCKGLVEVVL